MNSSVTVRPARVEDAEFLGWVQLEASRGHLKESLFKTFMRELDEEQLVRMMVEGVRADPELKLFTCWTGFLIVEVDGQPVAGML